VSLIGNLEQFKLSHVLQRVETHEKTGLLVVKQSQYWVEFYFRNGRLLCIGPVRTRVTLGERLVRDGLISSQALRDIQLSIGETEQSETRVALALMEGGHVRREDLRLWAIQKTTDALSAILGWSSGEIYFEDGTVAPSDRLLVSMSAMSIVDSIPPASSPSLPVQPVQASPPVRPAQGSSSPYTTVALDADAAPPSARRSTSSPSHLVMAPSNSLTPSKPSPTIDRVPTLMGAAQFGMSYPGVTKDTSQINESTGGFLNDNTGGSLNGAGGRADSFLNDASGVNLGQVANSASRPDLGKMVNPPSSANLTRDVSSSKPASSNNHAEGFLSAASLIDAFPANVFPTDALPATEALSPLFSAPNTEDFIFSGPDGGSDVNFAALVTSDTPASLPTSIVAVPVMQAQPPQRIDTSFMQPDMVLYPADLSPFRDQNPHVQITPDQWRLLLCVDGQTSLQAACHHLALPPEAVCLLAGELLAEGLIQVALPQQMAAPDVSQVSHELAASGLSNGYVAPGYAAAPASPWSASVPGFPAANVTTPRSPFVSGLPFETESQWGNGGNGATFIPGRGWITTPQPLQPLQSGEQMLSPSSSNFAYAYAGNGGY
jgi:hypothetical protein